VSEIAEWLWMEDEALCERGPSKRGVVRPLAERLRPGELREAALADCGVGDPLLVVSDGASAIIRAIEEWASPVRCASAA